uniref:Peptidase M14 domain-containing protein n=1 Tax=Dendroctonus ponderosae TaxID=77166 RepID=A0AAR5Q8Y9_DENPD
MKLLALSVLVLLCGLLEVQAEGYNGYKVYQVTPKTLQQADILHQLHEDPEFDFFQDAKLLGQPMSIMASPRVQQYFETTLANLTHEGLDYTVTTEDVQKVLDEEYADFVRRNASRQAGARAVFDEYISHAEVLAYLERLEREHPEIVRLESIGRSTEGRDLLLIHIGSGRPNAPTIFIDAGIHAREWIATPSALYIISQLVENPAHARLHQNVNWAIIPAINPDGYEFSRSSVLNRLWRKTRRPNQGSTCIGTDPNRNFGYQWNTGGASTNPCSDIYAGPEPFSEPETDAIRRYFINHYTEIKLYVTIHSYGNYILYPWGFTSELPRDALHLQTVAEAAARPIEAASTLGSRYTIGSSTNVLYEASGGSDDWTKGAIGVDLSYCFELPGGGSFGFNPPVAMIRPIVEETFEGFIALGEYIASLYG